MRVGSLATCSLSVFVCLPYYSFARHVRIAPSGICTHDHYRDGPGAAGPLRGRKRDVWEGGHRIPSIVSWPDVVQGDTGEFCAMHEAILSVLAS